MGDVIPFNQPKNGDTTFLACPCTPEPNALLPVAVIGKPVIIVALLCPMCEREIPVLNGELVGVGEN